MENTVLSLLLFIYSHQHRWLSRYLVIGFYFARLSSLYGVPVIKTHNLSRTTKPVKKAVYLKWNDSAPKTKEELTAIADREYWSNQTHSKKKSPGHFQRPRANLRLILRFIVELFHMDIRIKERWRRFKAPIMIKLFSFLCLYFGMIGMMTFILFWL